MTRVFACFSLVFFACFNAVAEDSICFDDQNAFASTAPKGWIADYHKGKELGNCVVYYLKGFTFDSSPAILYPNLVKSSSSSSAIQEIVDLNGKKLTEKKPDIRIEKRSGLKNGKGILFETRYFLDGPAPQEYEAVAYHAGKGSSVLMAVLSTRNKTDFAKHESSLAEFLGTVRSVSRSELELYKRKCGAKLPCK